MIIASSSSFGTESLTCNYQSDFNGQFFCEVITKFCSVSVVKHAPAEQTSDFIPAALFAWRCPLWFLLVVQPFFFFLFFFNKHSSTNWRFIYALDANLACSNKAFLGYVGEKKLLTSEKKSFFSFLLKISDSCSISSEPDFLFFFFSSPFLPCLPACRDILIAYP